MLTPDETIKFYITDNRWMRENFVFYVLMVALN